jgi:DNA-binding transcriptional MerR regulator
MEHFSPAQVVQRTGFSLDTLRYYERIGLLEPIDRDTAGRRRFRTRDLDWLHMVRYLRDTGMPISQMLRYATLSRSGDHTSTERMALLVEHEARVSAHIARLHKQRDQLRQKIAWYREELAS